MSSQLPSRDNMASEKLSAFSLRYHDFSSALMTDEHVAGPHLVDKHGVPRQNLQREHPQTMRQRRQEHRV